MINKCRFLGRSCIELITLDDHLIIDPRFFEAPKKGIKQIFLTHEHEDHCDINKISLIREKYTNDENELKIFGPKSIKKEYELDLEIIKKGSKIDLKNTKIEAFEIECYKAEECLAYLISVGDISILHTADAATISDRLKNFSGKVDYCFIACFEEYFDDYLMFLRDLHPLVAIPYHFNPGEEHKAKKLVEFLDDNYIEAKFMKIGEALEF
ncbi:MAG: hypothetical protein GF383_03455 [Candidatus Lokiarchaeota archaeon]|nr:hypothetical protein [Candidatus Lokiarchaeota archaeon]MBD3338702.1 hypothetical protein [Candidatus Lokiarchaeota archaeon]